MASCCNTVISRCLGREVDYCQEAFCRANMNLPQVHGLAGTGRGWQVAKEPQPRRFDRYFLVWGLRLIGRGAPGGKGSRCVQQGPRSAAANTTDRPPRINFVCKRLSAMVTCCDLLRLMENWCCRWFHGARIAVAQTPLTGPDPDLWTNTGLGHISRAGRIRLSMLKLSQLVRGHL